MRVRGRATLGGPGPRATAPEPPSTRRWSATAYGKGAPLPPYESGRAGDSPTRPFGRLARPMVYLQRTFFPRLWHWITSDVESVVDPSVTVRTTV